MTKPVTRMDFDQDGGFGVLVKEWEEGWVEGDAPTTFHFETGANVYRLLMGIEDQGFACEMCDAFHGRALRGKITRIDFEQAKDRTVVKKYPYGWTAKTKPIQQYSITPEAFKDSVQWCKDHGWTIREWPGGARAFNGPEMPVRSTSAIMAMRRAVDKNLWAGQLDNRRAYDLAFDF